MEWRGVELVNLQPGYTVEHRFEVVGSTGWTKAGIMGRWPRLLGAAMSSMTWTLWQGKVRRKRRVEEGKGGLEWAFRLTKSGEKGSIREMISVCKDISW